MSFWILGHISVKINRIEREMINMKQYFMIVWQMKDLTNNSIRSHLEQFSFKKIDQAKWQMTMSDEVDNVAFLEIEEESVTLNEVLYVMRKEVLHGVNIVGTPTMYIKQVDDLYPSL